MRPKLDPRLKMNRTRHPLGIEPSRDEREGAFVVMGPNHRQLFIMASVTDRWDHVSVSVVDTRETPTWDEMCWVKDLFFDYEETVVQYHPPRSLYVNFHNGCLHLWRPQGFEYVLPPLWMV